MKLTGITILISLLAFNVAQADWVNKGKNDSLYAQGGSDDGEAVLVYACGKEGCHLFIDMDVQCHVGGNFSAMIRVDGLGAGVMPVILNCIRTTETRGQYMVTPMTSEYTETQILRALEVNEYASLVMAERGKWTIKNFGLAGAKETVTAVLNTQ